MPNITMSQIAEAAGVSQATVSFVLNKRRRANGSISTETAHRVQQIARELGYRPNRSAKALATGRSDLVGLCMWNLAPAHYANVTRHVENELRESGQHLLVSSLKAKRQESDPKLFQEIFPWPLDGVLALEAGNVLSTHWENFHSWPAPIVSIGGTNFEIENLDYVGIDLETGVQQAINHLISIGCRRIAFISKENLLEPEVRAVAYRKTILHHKMPTEFIPLSANTRSAALEEIKNYVRTNGCPDGILCFNDEVALGGYRALCDLGIKVPQQVAIIGCDGIEDTEYLECPLSTIVQPVEEMCHFAWKTLQERIRYPGKEVTQKVLLSQLVIRDSSLYFGGKVK